MAGAQTSAIHRINLFTDGNIDSGILTTPLVVETAPPSLVNPINGARIFSMPVLRGSTLALALVSAIGARALSVSATLWVRDTDGQLWLPVAAFSTATRTAPAKLASVFLERVTASAVLQITALTATPLAGEELCLFQLLGSIALSLTNPAQGV